MPIISFGADCSAFLKAADQVQQSARQVAAAALEARRAVQSLADNKSYAGFIAESDKAADAADGVRASTVKAASGASGALKQLAAEAETTRKALQKTTGAEGLHSIATAAQKTSANLSTIGTMAGIAKNAVASMAQTATKEQEKALGSLGTYTTKLGEMNIRTRSLGETLEAGYYDLDRSLSHCFENILTGAKVSFDGVLGAFTGMLAEMANQAFIRPVTLRIMGSIADTMGVSIGKEGAGANAGANVVGAVGQGVAGAGIGAGLPNLFGAAGQTAVGAIGTAIPYVGMALMGKSLMDSLTNGMSDNNIVKKSWNVIDKNSMQGGPGFFGWGDVMDLLKKDKFSQASMAVGPFGVLGSATTRSFNKILGVSGGNGEKIGNVTSLLLGDPLLGGALGALFGGGRKTRPSVYTKALDMGIDTDIDYTKKFMDGAWFDRAGSKEAQAVMPVLGEAAKATAAQIEALTATLPEDYRTQVEAELAKATWSAGRGVEGMDKKNWNFQFYDEEQLKERLTAVTDDIQKAMLRAAEDALDRVDLSGMGLTFDTSTLEGLGKAAKALEAFRDVTADIDSALNPLSEYAAIQKSINDQVDAWKTQLTDLGFTEAKVAEIEANRTALLEKALEPMRTAFAQDMRLREAQVSGNATLIASTQLTVQHEKELASMRVKFGADSAEYARVLGVQAQELAQLTTQLAAQLAAQKVAFGQDMQVRLAQLSGNAELIASTQLTIQHEKELADIRVRFGENSAQVAELQYMHSAEMARLMLQNQQAAMQKALQQQATAAQERLALAGKAESTANAALSKAQSDLNAVRSAYLAALNKEAASLKTTINAVSNAVAQLSRTRRDLLTSPVASPLGTAERYALSGAELEQVFTKAMSGDAEAMAELAGLSSKFLESSKEANADFSKYRKDFDRVQTMLAAVEAAGGMQIDTAQKQLDLLNAQIAAATEGTGQIVGSIKELEIAFVAALGDYAKAQEDAARAQEAARKAQEAADEARRKAEEAADKAQQESAGNAPKTWMQDVLERKAADLNRQGDTSWGVSAGKWTVNDVLRAIAGNGLTFADWYEKFGKFEGFAAGGISPANAPSGLPSLTSWAGKQAPFWTGENGPELVVSPQEYGVLNNRASFALAGAASGSRSRASDVAVTHELLQEIRALRREVTDLRAEQGRGLFSVADAAQRTARKLEQFDFDGLPGTRKQ